MWSLTVHWFICNTKMKSDYEMNEVSPFYYKKFFIHLKLWIISKHSFDDYKKQTQIDFTLDSSWLLPYISDLHEYKRRIILVFIQI